MHCPVTAPPPLTGEPKGPNLLLQGQGERYLLLLSPSHLIRASSVSTKLEK